LARGKLRRLRPRMAWRCFVGRAFGALGTRDRRRAGMANARLFALAQLLAQLVWWMRVRRCMLSYLVGRAVTRTIGAVLFDEALGRERPNAPSSRARGRCERREHEPVPKMRHVTRLDVETGRCVRHVFAM
jgi:hypothetical protein